MKNFVNSKQAEFLEFLKNFKSASEKSVSTYESVLNDGLNKIEFIKNKDLVYVDFMPYRAKIKDQQKATIAKKISLMRTFFKWLKKTYNVSFVLKNDSQIRVPKRLPKPIKQAYIDEALSTCSGMDELILLFFYSLGLRISELSSLTKDDFSSSWVRIYGKGSKERMVPVLPHVSNKLNAYIEKNNIEKHIFIENGKKLSDNQIRYKITKVFKRIGIKVTPHQLRHSFASDLLNNGARITDVSELLGHSKLSTTQIYTKLSSKLKLKSYLESHPLCKDEDVIKDY